ncbi:MAG: PLP-dependent transferase, partial [Chthoniobacterales bacterium]
APDADLELTLRNRLAAWSGAPAANISLHPSGMAAIFTAFEAVTARRPGRRTVMFGFPYTDTLKILSKFGHGVEFYPRGDAEDLARLRDLLAQEEIAGIFCEFPSNPLLHVPDLPALHAMAAAKGVPVVVDDTIGTFFNVDVLPHADFVATSLTKAISGEGDVMAGALTVNPHGLFAALPPSTAPGGIYARDLQILERNARDFPERMKIANRNAMELAAWLATQRGVEKVSYPGLDPSPVYEQLRKSGGGYGAVISFLPRDAARNTPRIFEKLRVSRGISLGTSYSLVCPYVQLAHYHELGWARACGIDPYLLRIAVGTEPWEDLRRRFEGALALKEHGRGYPRPCLVQAVGFPGSVAGSSEGLLFQGKHPRTDFFHARHRVNASGEIGLRVGNFPNVFVLLQTLQDRVDIHRTAGALEDFVDRRCERTARGRRALLAFERRGARF